MTDLFTLNLLRVQTPDQLANVLGFSKYSALAKLLYPSVKYTTFEVKKKNGGMRVIQAPSDWLKTIQRKVLTALNELDASRPSVHGFIKNKSVVTNAQVHANKKKQHILNLDLKDFFPSITFGRVKGVFSNEPFNFPNNVAVVLARICTHEGVLPQGSPTSPPLSNYICRGLDGQLQELARKNFATYSRYADDLTFSFSRKHRESLPHAIVQFQEKTAVVGRDLESVIQQHGFSINVSKTRLCSRTSRMEVTGLTVNEFPNVKRKYIDEIRGMLNAWSKHGLEKAQAVFEQKTYKRQLRNEYRPRLEHVLRGKLTYLHMVKGVNDRVYNSLAQRFNDCLKKYESKGVKAVPVADIVFNEKEFEQAVFIISAKDNANNFGNLGTAFFLEGVGIVTCDHVLRYPSAKDEAEKFAIQDHQRGKLLQGNSIQIFLQDTIDSNLCELEIMWTDQVADVAVLKPRHGKAFHHLSFRRTTEPQSKNILLIGYPNHRMGKTLSIADGKIRSRYSQKALRHIDINAFIRTGNSGGPVLDLNRQVIGVAKEGERQDGGNNAVLHIDELIKLHATNLHRLASEPTASPL